MRPNVFTSISMLLLFLYVLSSVGIAFAIPNLDKPKESPVTPKPPPPDEGPEIIIGIDPLESEKEKFDTAEKRMLLAIDHLEAALRVMGDRNSEYNANREELYRDNRADAMDIDPIGLLRTLIKTVLDFTDELLLADKLSAAIANAFAKNMALKSAITVRDAAWEELLDAAAAIGISESEVGREKSGYPDPMPDDVEFPDTPSPLCPGCNHIATDVTEHVAYCDDPGHPESLPYFKCAHDKCPGFLHHQLAACRGGCDEMFPVPTDNVDTYYYDHKIRCLEDVTGFLSCRTAYFTCQAESGICPTRPITSYSQRAVSIKWRGVTQRHSPHIAVLTGHRSPAHKRSRTQTTVMVI